MRGKPVRDDSAPAPARNPFGDSSLVRLYLDADDTADMTIQVVHAQGTVMNADDFML